LRVGRTEFADVAFPKDTRMSGVHFLLESDDAACYVEDLGSRNGTFVSDMRITKRTRLRNHDQLLAGDTKFTVLLDDDVAGAASRQAMAAADEAAAPREITQSGPASPTLPTVRFTVEKCDSGLTLCRGTLDEIQPADLAVRLCRVLPVYLIADFGHMGSSPPEELTQPTYLFDWLDPVAAAVISPVIISQEDLLTWPKVVEQGWGSDAVVCLFSNQEKPLLVEHLRRVCRSKMNATDPNAAILGYCWPSVLAPLLSHYTPELTQQLLSGIDAVLVELPDLPDTWQVYGVGQVVDLLERIGFRPRSADESETRA
jgi:hypothetical protein